MSQTHQWNKAYHHFYELTPYRVLSQTLAYWQAQDVEQTVSMYSEDIVYRSFSFHKSRPSVQLLRGHDEIRDMLFHVLAEFDYLRYDPVILDVTGQMARVQVQFDLRHRQSGERLTGSKRQFYAIGDGKVQRINQFHDEAMVAAFFRMIRGASAPMQTGTGTGTGTKSL
jgi:ketosteroid isomerase-like protein